MSSSFATTHGGSAAWDSTDIEMHDRVERVRLRHSKLTAKQGDGSILMSRWNKRVEVAMEGDEKNNVEHYLRLNAAIPSVVSLF